MSIRSEIRAALVDGPKTIDELLPLVASVEGDRARLAQNVSTLHNAALVRRVGLSEDRKPIYALDPTMWAAKATHDDADADIATESRKASTAKKASPSKAQRPDADPARKAANKPAAKARARQPAAALHQTSGPKKPQAKKAKVLATLPALNLPYPVPGAAPDRTFVGLMASGNIRVQDAVSGFHLDLPLGVAEQVAALVRMVIR